MNKLTTIVAAALITLLLSACSTSPSHLQRPQSFNRPLEHSHIVTDEYHHSRTRDCYSPVRPGDSITIHDPFAVFVISVALITWQLACDADERSERVGIN